MPYVVAAVTATGLLCLFNFTLCLGLLRRMRVQAEQLAGLTRGSDQLGRDRLLVSGTVVSDYAATTVDGEPVSRELLTGPTLVAFLSPGCKPCALLLPRLIDFAPTMLGGRAQVLAVLTLARPEDSAEYARRLDPVARVVVEDGHGPLSEAYRADGLPCLYLVDTGGVVIAGGIDAGFLDRLPARAAADAR
jgi:hypothetical protein